MGGEEIKWRQPAHDNYGASKDISVDSTAETKWPETMPPI